MNEFTWDERGQFLLDAVQSMSIALASVAELVADGPAALDRDVLVQAVREEIQRLPELAAEQVELALEIDRPDLAAKLCRPEPRRDRGHLHLVPQPR